MPRKDAVEKRPGDEKLWAIRDQIVGKLKAKGGDGRRMMVGNPGPRMNVDYVLIVEGENVDKSEKQCLLLDAEGDWTMEYGGSGISLGKPSMDRILMSLASVSVDEAKGLSVPELKGFVQRKKVVLLNQLRDTLQLASSKLK